MKVFFKILLIPYVFLWLVNYKIAVWDEPIFLSFVYAYAASLVIIAARTLTGRLERSSVLALGLFIVLLTPTLGFQIFGVTDRVDFPHASGFPAEAILKLGLVLVVFTSFNELLANNAVSAAYMLKLFALGVLLSIPKYLFENYELIRHLDTYDNRPFPLWIGGWNTYGFILSLAFVIVQEAVFVSSAVRYAVMSVIFVVMITTLSRGAILALLVTLFLSWRSTRTTRTTTGPKHSGAKLLLAGIVPVVIVVASIPGIGDTIYDRFVTSFLESQYEGTGYLQSVSSARSVLWLDTLIKLVSLDHYYQWLFGYGVGHYAYETTYGFESAMGNQYILWVYEFGWIVGVALSLAMFRAYLRMRWRTDAWTARAIKAMFAIFLVSNFVEDFAYSTQVGWIIGAGGALVLDVARRERERRVVRETENVGGAGHAPAAAWPGNGTLDLARS